MKLKIVLIMVGMGLFFLGPGWFFVYAPTIVAWDRTMEPEAYVLQRDGGNKNIKPGNESKIIWASSSKAKTKFSLVYLHGFSASPHEIYPIVESVSKGLSINAFLPRLSSHGVTGDRMQSLTSNQLFQDAEDAYSMGKLLGENVILIGTSTGASLSYWLASRHPDASKLILISPNFGVKDPKGFLGGGPLGYWMARILVGQNYKWEPKNAEQSNYWSTQYDVQGLRVMTDIVREASEVSPELIKMPLLVLYSDNDDVIDIPRAIEFLNRSPSPKKKFIEFKGAGHVLAGEVTAPENIEKVVLQIKNFIQSISSL